MKIALWLLDPSDNKEYSFDSACQRFRVAGGGPLHRLNALWTVLQTQLRENGVLECLPVETRLSPVLASMELSGMVYDQELMERHKASLRAKMAILQQDASRICGVRDVNLGSADQMARVLFDQLGLRVPSKRTASGKRESLTQEDLLSLRDSHPLPGIILDYRKIQVPVLHLLVSLIVSAEAAERVGSRSG